MRGLQKYDLRRNENLFGKPDMTQMESWSRAPRGVDEVSRVLVGMARKVGNVYGVYLSVGRRGEAQKEGEDDVAFGHDGPSP